MQGEGMVEGWADGAGEGEGKVRVKGRVQEGVKGTVNISTTLCSCTTWARKPR